MNRREFLAGVGVAAAGLSLHKFAIADAPVVKQRSIRLAFVNDIHLQPELRAGEGYTACLRHLQSQSPKVELILFGGDVVMDSNDVGRERTQLQWDLWKKITKAESSLPFEACLGNHDIWGLNKTKSGLTGNEPGFGKKLAADMLGMEKTYRSFTNAGWKFVVLDNVQPGEAPGSYAGFLDPPQMDWLTKELESTPNEMPILLFGHIPILSALELQRKRQTPMSDLRVSSALMHTDASALSELFFKHPNVKLCLSGHLHALDRTEILGVAYCCMGSVCGNWWKGPLGHYPEGYSIVDLNSDGTFDIKYVQYGWKAQDS